MSTSYFPAPISNQVNLQAPAFEPAACPLFTAASLPFANNLKADLRAEQKEQRMTGHMSAQKAACSFAEMPALPATHSSSSALKKNPFKVDRAYKEFKVDVGYHGKPDHFDEAECNTELSNSTRVSSHGSDSDFEDSHAIPAFVHAASTKSVQLTKKAASANVAQEGQWKHKLKTELCKFWLDGVACENLQKDQGCGFAHGELELNPKRGLNKQYLTSVCKNFLQSPSKCQYGHRCIFQHPSLDVKERQPYRTMMKDNVRYTAMRMFQNIPGADTVYINTYAMNTPRLACFKSIVGNSKGAEGSSDEE